MAQNMAPYVDEGHYIKDPDIRWVYEHDIAEKTRLIKSKKALYGLKFGQKFSRKSGFYTFSLWEG